MQDDAQQLWNFSVALYQQEGVERACLELQARYGLSVSLLLGAIWVGMSGRGRLAAKELETAVGRVMAWHREVIEPVRALRQQLKREAPAGVEAQTTELRHQLLRAELTAEGIEQRLFLQDMPPRSAHRGGERWQDAAANAVLVLRRTCPRLEQEALDALAAIIRAASPQVPLAALHDEIAAAR